MADFTGAVWRKAARSNGSGGNCVEIAFVDDVVGVRDSKDPEKAPHVYTHPEWEAFLDGAKKGEFDLPQV